MRKMTRAPGGLMARVTQFAGAGVLVLGTALAFTAAPAAASGEDQLPTGGSLVQSVPCTNQDNAAATTPNGANGDHLCGQIPVTKVDSWTGKPLAGAGFTLYWGACPKDGVLDSNDIVEGPNPAANPSALTDSTGTTTFSPVYFRWWGGKQYCVAESTVPAGYTGSAPQTVTVYGHYKDETTDPPTVECKAPVEENSDVAKVNDETLPQICVTSATFTNDPIPVNIDISKYIASSGAGLNGATFTLEHTDGSSVTTGTGGVVNGAASCLTAGGTSTTAGKCSILNVMIAGNYLLHETPPTGYDAVADIPVPITLGSPDVIVVITDHATVTTAPAAATAAAGGSTVTGATTVHTGESFAGSAPYVLATLGLGSSLLGFGLVRRRRAGRVNA